MRIFVANLALTTTEEALVQLGVIAPFPPSYAANGCC